MPFDKASSTVPQNIGKFVVFYFKLLFLNISFSTGIYSVGWLSSGPIGVILSTMSNAFQTAFLIGQHFETGLLNEQKPGYDYVSNILEKKGIYFNRTILSLILQQEKFSLVCCSKSTSIFFPPSLDFLFIFVVFFCFIHIFNPLLVTLIF